MLGKMDIRKRETVTQASLIVIGSLAYSIGLNMMITPLALYNGGFMGIAQLIRTFLVSVLHIKMPPGMDIAGAIYYILNVPLFYMGYRIMGKGFFVKSLFGTTVISIFLVLVPVPATPIIEDYRRDYRRLWKRRDTQRKRNGRRSGHHRRMLPEEKAEYQCGTGKYFPESGCIWNLSVYV